MTTSLESESPAITSVAQSEADGAIQTTSDSSAVAPAPEAQTEVDSAAVQTTANSATTSSSSVTNSSTSSENVLISGSGDGTYYYDYTGKTCPNQAEYPENNGYTSCEPSSGYKTLASRTNNNIVALALDQVTNHKAELCGKRVIVYHNGVEVNATFVVWDSCLACTGGVRLDFSLSALSAIDADACTLGVVPGISWKVVDEQIIEYLNRIILSMSSSTRTCVSAPGKVLVAGGYLVLDQAYSGLVIGTSSRFYTTITSLPRSTSSSTISRKTITVRSPQFDDGRWVYTVSMGVPDVPPVSLVQDCNVNPNGNKFVEYAVSLTLSVAASKCVDFTEKLGGGLDILIVGHNDFYSQRAQLASQKLPVSTTSLSSLQPFCSTMTTIGKVHKTGLGSSAAMITSLVSALLVHFGAITLSPNTVSRNSTQRADVELAHNMAQFIHCLAQGKVGSGFDVSAAVYGSHVYRRFNPAILTSLMARCDEVGIGKVSAREILDVVAGPTRWDTIVQPFKLPEGIKLMLADVNAGSNTPQLVSAVLEWRKSEELDALELWELLNKENMQVAETLIKLSEKASSHPSEFLEARRRFSRTTGNTWLDNAANDSERLLAHLHASFLKVRVYLREMSIYAKVPVEPPSQTRLLNAIYKVPGVIMSGIPGAGGFDAIFVLVVEDVREGNPDTVARGENVEAIEEVWRTWRLSEVGPLLAGADSNLGISIEDVEKVPGLKMRL
ncbi:phosphomevalonate kinase [Entophlyctis luteolus]|nr:phosphomevalonate kinase [Entophlyctis luteolus]